MAGTPPAEPTLQEQRDVLLAHFDLSMKLHGERAASRMMRKFGIKFSIHHPDPNAVKSGFIRCQGMDDWRKVLEQHYA